MQKLTGLFQDNSHSYGGINAGPGKNPVQGGHCSLRKYHEQENHKPEPETPISFDRAKKSFRAQKHPFQLFHWQFLFLLFQYSPANHTPAGKVRYCLWLCGLHRYREPFLVQTGYQSKFTRIKPLSGVRRKGNFILLPC